MKFDFTSGDRGTVLDDTGSSVECLSGDTEQGWRVEYVRNENGHLIDDPRGGYKKRVVRGRIIFLRHSDEDLPLRPPVHPPEAA
jgi:hypothetical protein